MRWRSQASKTKAPPRATSSSATAATIFDLVIGFAAIALVSSGCDCGKGNVKGTLGDLGIVWRDAAGERVVNRYIEIPVEKLIEKQVIVERVVEVPVFVDQVVEVPVVQQVENVIIEEIEVEREVVIEAIIEKEVEVIEERIVEIPVEKIVEVEVEILVERPVYVETIVEEDVVIETTVDSFQQEQSFNTTSVDVDDAGFA